MSYFKIGDIVRHFYFGKGVIKFVDTSFESPVYAVEFYCLANGFDCYGYCKRGSGFWCDRKDLKLVIEESEK